MPPWSSGSETLTPTKLPIDSASSSTRDTSTPSLGETPFGRNTAELIEDGGAQPAHRVLAKVAPIDVHPELEEPNRKGDSDISPCEEDDRSSAATHDGIIDDPPLEL